MWTTSWIWVEIKTAVEELWIRNTNVIESWKLAQGWTWKSSIEFKY